MKMIASLAALGVSLRSGALTAAAAASIVLALPTPATAQSDDIGDELADFWSRAGGTANVTRPQAFMGQQGGFVTGGSLVVRTRPRNTNIARIELPRIRAGCGGIDAFMGSFSFLSADQLIEMMEAIMQNAAGFAFELALESLSPAIQETVSNLRDLAQKVNAVNINSCEESQALVGSLWPRLDNASQAICRTVGVEEGFFADIARSRHACGPENQQRDTLDDASGPLADQVPVNINYAWKAIRKHPYFRTNYEIGELMMTLTGTMITRDGTGADGPSHDVFPPKAFTPEMVTAFIEGGTIRVLTCPTDDRVDCLAPTWQNVTISAGDALFARVRTLVDGLANAIETNTAPPAGAANLIGLTSTPVYEQLVQAIAARHIFIEDEIAIIAELVAIELAMHFMQQGLTEMAEAGAKIDVFGDKLAEFQESIRRSIDQFGIVRGEARDAYAQALKSIERLTLARSEGTARSTSRFATTLVRH